MRLAVALLGVLCAGLFAVTANASTQDPRLDALASSIDGRPMSVECVLKAEDPEMATVWGYTMRIPVNWVRVNATACAAALDPTSDPLWRALGILVVTHESYHQQLSYGARWNEGKVECRAIRHFTVSAEDLGYTADEAWALMPYALFWHYQTAHNPLYADPSCVVPHWLPPGEG